MPENDAYVTCKFAYVAKYMYLVTEVIDIRWKMKIIKTITFS